MITQISVKSFKSLENVADLELGQLNVFVGANGSGKSNLLEALGVLSAAAEGKVTDQTLLQRGVRPGLPQLYKSAFPSTPIGPHISLNARSTHSEYSVSLNNPLSDPAPAWRFKTESLLEGERIVATRSPASREKFNSENGLAALNIVALEETNPAVQLLRRLQNYVIYTPTTAVLRGVTPENQPRQPLGLSGGRLPDAIQELLASSNPRAADIQRQTLELIDWAQDYAAASASELLLSPAASSSPRVVRFTDRYMRKSRNRLSGYDASEGALYVLFMAVIGAHPKAPEFCAIDNADHGLNPGLAKQLFFYFSQWLLESGTQRQVLVTTHNPAVLDGLPLQDDRVRLFTVDRDTQGKTFVKRLVVDDKLLSYAEKGWTLSRLWTNKLIGGMPDV